MGAEAVDRASRVGTGLRAVLLAQVNHTCRCRGSGLEVGQAARHLGGLARRVGQEDKCCVFGSLFRKGVVEYEAKHATIVGLNVICANGNLVGVAFAMPVDELEALLTKLVRRGPGVFVREET